MTNDSPAAHYDRVTAAWKYLLGDDLHYGLFASEADDLARATENLTVLMAQWGEVDSDSVVLDVGCGTGNPAAWLARAFGCRVVGISNSRVGIAAAAVRAARLGLSSSIEFEYADAAAIGRPDASFNRAWLLESSHLMPEKERVIAECGRLLAPAGNLVLCDIIQPVRIELRKVLRHAAEFDLLRQVFGRARMAPMEDYAAWLGAHGFAVEESSDISVQVAPTFREWKGRAARHAREVSDLIGREALERFVQSCDVLQRLWMDRILGYGIIRARKE